MDTGLSKASRKTAAVATRGGCAEAMLELVHADTLRQFPQLVSELGGDAAALIRRAGLDPGVFPALKPKLGFRYVADLLELAAADLGRPDFGMRLAVRQGGGKAFGPVGVVMRNSRTLGEALAYAAAHLHAYTLGAAMRVEPIGEGGGVFASFELLLDRLPSVRQAVEQALLGAHLNALEITGGRARVREVHFRHAPLAPLRAYRAYFGCEARFGQPADGVVFAARDLQCPVIDPDAQLYEMATSFIDVHFQRVSPPLHARVRALVLRYIGGEYCTNERIAAELRLHPRTLHRRLKAEGKSFEAIKDEVRRDMALSLLQDTETPLIRVAERLGYAETSVLSRSCFRWFGAAPRQLRARVRLS